MSIRPRRDLVLGKSAPRRQPHGLLLRPGIESLDQQPTCPYCATIPPWSRRAGLMSRAAPSGSVPPCSVNPGIEERVVTADLRYGWVAETPTMTEEARDDRGEDGTVGVRAEERRAGLPAGAAAVHGA